MGLRPGVPTTVSRRITTTHRMTSPCLICVSAPQSPQRYVTCRRNQEGGRERRLERPGGRLQRPTLRVRCASSFGAKSHIHTHRSAYFSSRPANKDVPRRCASPASEPAFENSLKFRAAMTEKCPSSVAIMIYIISIDVYEQSLELKISGNS